MSHSSPALLAALLRFCAGVTSERTVRPRILVRHLLGPTAVVRAPLRSCSVLVAQLGGEWSIALRRHARGTDQLLARALGEYAIRAYDRRRPSRGKRKPWAPSSSPRTTPP